MSRIRRAALLMALLAVPGGVVDGLVVAAQAHAVVRTPSSKGAPVGAVPNTVFGAHTASACDPTGHCFETTVSVETGNGGVIRGVGSFDCYVPAGHALRQCFSEVGGLFFTRDGGNINGSNGEGFRCGPTSCSAGVNHFSTGWFIDLSGIQSYQTELSSSAVPCSCYTQGVGLDAFSSIVNHLKPTGPLPADMVRTTKKNLCNSTGHCVEGTVSLERNAAMTHMRGDFFLRCYSASGTHPCISIYHQDVTLHEVQQGGSDFQVGPYRNECGHDSFPACAGTESSFTIYWSNDPGLQSWWAKGGSPLIVTDGPSIVMNEFGTPPPFFQW